MPCTTSQAGYLYLLYRPSLLWPALSCSTSLASLGIHHIFQHKVEHLRKQGSTEHGGIGRSITPHHQQNLCFSNLFTPQ
jgi:hypothetical protein